MRWEARQTRGISINRGRLAPRAHASHQPPYVCFPLRLGYQSKSWKIHPGLPSMSRSAEASPGADTVSPPPTDSLDSLREELDALDDRLLDLLMARAALVERVGSAKRGTGPLRPGREAAILRRLLGQHQGPLPRPAIIRIWREIFAASVAQQQTVQVAVCDPAMDGRFLAAAREHLGALTPMRVYSSPAQAIGEVVDGRAGAAILPLPGEWPGDAAGPGWWPGLLQQHTKGRIHVVARLPFLASRPDGAPSVQALIVAQYPGRSVRRRHFPDRAGNRGAAQPAQPLQCHHGCRFPAHLHPRSPPGRRADRPACWSRWRDLSQPDDPRLSHIAGLQVPPLDRRRLCGRFRRGVPLHDQTRLARRRGPRSWRSPLMSVAHQPFRASVTHHQALVQRGRLRAAARRTRRHRSRRREDGALPGRQRPRAARGDRRAISASTRRASSAAMARTSSSACSSRPMAARGPRSLMSEYGFSIYEIFGTLAGAQVRKAPETRSCRRCRCAARGGHGARRRLVFLANPNNPTGIAAVPRRTPAAARRACRPMCCW